MQSPGFTLTVNGANFYPGALVSWNHLTRVTTFVSSTQLMASILSADLNVASATMADIYVTNPSPSAGSSNVLQFALENPAPTISAISPDTGLAGDYTVVQITGTKFIYGATVQADGQNWTTAYTNSTTLAATGQLGRAGSVTLTVTNPAPNAGPSNPVQFESKAAGNPMKPQLVTIDPSGQPAPFSSWTSIPGISSPGRFASFANSTGAFLRDTCLGVATACTPSTVSGIASGQLSDDGRFVVFLAPHGPASGYYQLTVADLCTGATNCTPSIAPSAYASTSPEMSSLSASGRYVPFSMPQISPPAGIYDSCSGALPGCAPGLIAVGNSNTGAGLPVISRDARYATFQGSSDSGFGIAFQNTCIGAAPGCVPTISALSGDPCGGPTMSRNAQYAAYDCLVDNDYTDTEIRVAQTCMQGDQGCSTAPIAAVFPTGVRYEYYWSRRLIWISDSGRYVVYWGETPSRKLNTVLISDTCIGTSSECQPQTAYACLNTDGALANDFCTPIGMSDDGKYIFYHSAATNLVPGIGGNSRVSPLSWGYVVANPLE